MRQARQQRKKSVPGLQIDGPRELDRLEKVGKRESTIANMRVASLILKKYPRFEVFLYVYTFLIFSFIAI